MKKKNSQMILFIIVGLVIVIALLIPYTTDNIDSVDSNDIELSIKTLSCDDDNPESEHETSLNIVSCDEYNDIVESEDSSLILYARPTCSYCNKFVPVLEEIQNEYDITINYYDIDIMSQDETNEFYSSSSLFSGDEFGTPTLAVIKNGKIVNYSIGYKEKDEAIDFIKSEGFINE